MSAELDPRPTRSPGKEDLPQATRDASAATALRHMGLGFLLGFLLCAILAGVLMWFLRRPSPPPIVLHPPPTAAPTSTPLPTATPGPLFVFVSGGVQNPGLVELPAGARVGDALAKAGGLLADADPALVNQAEIVSTARRFMCPCRNPRPAQTRHRPCRLQISPHPAYRARFCQTPRPPQVTPMRRPADWSTSTPPQPRNSQPYPASAPAKLPPSSSTALTVRSTICSGSPVSAPAQSRRSRPWSQQNSFPSPAFSGSRVQLLKTGLRHLPQDRQGDAGAEECRRWTNQMGDVEECEADIRSVDAV